MKRKLMIIMSLLLVVVLSGCGFNKNEDATSNIETESQVAEDDTETIKLSEKEWYQEYDNPKILLTYVWAEDVSAYGLSKESADFIDGNDELFPAKDKEKVVELVDESITYKHIEKTHEKYATSLFEIKGYIISIEEANIEDFGIATLLHIIDEDLQSYQIIYFDELPDVFKEDTVYVVGLPLSMGGFENVSGGYTNTVVTLGSYIEKIE